MANGQMLDVAEMYVIGSTSQTVIFFVQQIDDERSKRIPPYTSQCLDCSARALFGCRGPATVSPELTLVELKMGKASTRLNMAVIPPGYLRTCLDNMGIPDIGVS